MNLSKTASAIQLFKAAEYSAKSFLGVLTLVAETPY